MKVLNIEDCCISDGPGIRLSIYCSGCELHCPGCHNPESWDFKKGTDYSVSEEDLLMAKIKRSYIDGVTFCGGEPLHPKNIDAFTSLAERIKRECPEKNIWCYTGNEFEDVKHLAILQYIDVLVVGPFLVDKRDVSDNNRWRGSTNQRVVDVQASLKEGRQINLAGIPNNS